MRDAVGEQRVDARPCREYLGLTNSARGGIAIPGGPHVPT
jgi:hypothetical protein